MSGDLYFNNVKLLLSMDGDNNGTVFTDLSPMAVAVTRAGTILPVTVSSPVKYGTASGYFRRLGSSTSTSYLTATTSAIGTAPFTLEFWYVRQSSGNAILFSTNNNSSYSSSPLPSNATAFVLSCSAIATTFYLTFTSNDVVLTGARALLADTWHHVAVSRDASNVVRVFLDGNLEASGTYTNDFSSPYCTIGQTPNLATGYSRWIDDLRLTIGVCRYTDSFTPPTGPHPTKYGAEGSISGTVYEKNSDGVYVPGAYPVRLYLRSTGELVASTTSNADGSYLIEGALEQEYYVVALDNNAPYQQAAIADKVTPT